MCDFVTDLYERVCSYSKVTISFMAELSLAQKVRIAWQTPNPAKTATQTNALIAQYGDDAVAHETRVVFAKRCTI